MRTFELLNHERQIILGTLLGTSCVRKHPRGKNYSMYMRSVEDRDWFRVKCKHLEQFARDPYSDNLTWESCSHPMWNEFRDSFYKDGKKHVTMELLDALTDIGLSTWFLDKGGVCSRRAYIRVANLGGHDVIQRFFSEVDYPCVIKKKIVIFDPVVSQRFLKNVTPCFPKYLLERSDPYRSRKYL